MPQSSATTTEILPPATGGKAVHQLPESYRPFVMPSVVDTGRAWPRRRCARSGVSAGDRP